MKTPLTRESTLADMQRRIEHLESLGCSFKGERAGSFDGSIEPFCVRVFYPHGCTAHDYMSDSIIDAYIEAVNAVERHLLP